MGFFRPRFAIVPRYRKLLFPLLDMVHQKRFGRCQIRRNTEPRRVRECEAAVDEGREGFGEHRLERVFHGIMLKQSVTADSGQHMRGRVQTDT